MFCNPALPLRPGVGGGYKTQIGCCFGLWYQDLWCVHSCHGRKVCMVMIQAHVIALHTLQNIPDQSHNWNVTERPCNEYYICINCAQFRYTILFAFRKDNIAFREAVTKLEQNQICQGLPIQSFLTLPMQRITRLPCW